MRLKVTVFPLENVVSLIEGCKKEKKPFQASHSISHCRVGQSYHVMSSNDDAIKHMLSKFCATSQQQNYSNQSTVLFQKFQHMPSSPASVFNSFHLLQKTEYTVISSSQAHDKNELQTTGNPTELKSSLLIEGHSTLLKKEVRKKRTLDVDCSLAIFTVWQQLWSIKSPTEAISTHLDKILH